MHAHMWKYRAILEVSMSSTNFQQHCHKIRPHNTFQTHHTILTLQKDWNWLETIPQTLNILRAPTEVMSTQMFCLKPCWIPLWTKHFWSLTTQLFRKQVHLLFFFELIAHHTCVCLTEALELRALERQPQEWAGGNGQEYSHKSIAKTLPTCDGQDLKQNGNHIQPVAEEPHTTWQSFCCYEVWGPIHFGFQFCANPSIFT